MENSDMHKCDEVIPVTRAGLAKLCEAVYTDMCADAFIGGGCSDDDEGHANIDIEVCHDITATVYVGEIFTCSECGATTTLHGDDGKYVIRGGELRFCPNCGCKVVEANADK